MAAKVTQVFVEVLRSSAVVPGAFVHAVTSLALADLAASLVPAFHVTGVSLITLTPSPQGGGDVEVASTTQLILSANQFVHNPSQYVSACTGLNLQGLAVTGHDLPVQASSHVAFAAMGLVRSAFAPGVLPVSAATTVHFTADRGNADALRVFLVSAGTTLGLGETTVPAIWALLHGTGTAALKLGVKALALREANANATTTVLLGEFVQAARDVNAAAVTRVGLGQDQGGSNTFQYNGAMNRFTLVDLAAVITAGKDGISYLRFTHRADARVVLPSGGGVPGGAQSGLRTVLLNDTDGAFPNSYAETTSGLILVANGMNAMVRWDAMTGLADTAGVQAATDPIQLGGVGVGTITGRRVAFVRFLDGNGNPSNLSPVSNEVDFGRDGLIERIEYDKATGQVTITATAHGLATGAPILIDGVVGLPIDGLYTIAVVDDDRFTLIGLTITAGTLQCAGRWVYGIKSVLYGNVPVPTEAKVVRRQILRNLDGQSAVFYVDIDTDDLTSPAFASQRSDDDLAAGLPVPLFTAEGTPHADRYDVPPAHKAIIAAHQGRIFAAGEVAYTAGNAEPVFGQTTIFGTGTAWKRSMIGRLVYMVGAQKTYEIADVDETGQTITTTAVIQDATGPFTSYAIRPAPAERKLVYFSEPGLPEAWPPWNAISVPEDSDEITGLMVKGSFLFLLERRHIYKFTFQNDPARDGFVFLTTRRGCVNHRCFVQVEDTAYLLDESGLYTFDGGHAESISTPIQNLFQKADSGLQVNWQADQRYWHAAHDPVRDTIRWFVAMTGHLYPRHAICYDYRRQRFWIEEYPFAMSASSVATIGYRRSLAGSEARRVLCLGEGALDAVDEGNGLRGQVSNAGPLTLTDSSAPFPPGLAGAPVSIAQGRGFGQQRKIAANTADTLSIDRPWLVRPDASSVYQIGGINWTWQSGWFRFVDQELDNARDVEVVFQPVKTPSSIALRLYYDHDDQPRAWARTIEQDGTATIEGLPEVAMDMTYKQGQSVHRLTGHRDPRAVGDSFVSVELAGVQAGEIHRIYQVTVNGVRPS